MGARECPPSSLSFEICLYLSSTSLSFLCNSVARSLSSSYLYWIYLSASWSLSFRVETSLTLTFSVFLSRLSMSSFNLSFSFSRLLMMASAFLILAFSSEITPLDSSTYSSSWSIFVLMDWFSAFSCPAVLCTAMLCLLSPSTSSWSPLISSSCKRLFLPRSSNSLCRFFVFLSRPSILFLALPSSCCYLDSLLLRSALWFSIYLSFLL